MAVNRYDRAAEAPIMNTYVPINFGELYRIGAALKAAVDQAAKELNDAVVKFGEFRSPSAVDTANYYKLSRDKMLPYVDAAAQNPDLMKDASFRAAFRLQLAGLDYASMAMLKESADWQRQGLTMRAKMEAEGRYKQSWGQSDIPNYDTLQNGVFSDVTPLRWMSANELSNPYFDQLKPSSLGSVWKDGVKYNRTGIAEDTLFGISAARLNDLIATPQGQMYYRDLLEANGGDADAAKQAFIGMIADSQRDRLVYQDTVDPAWLLMSLQDMKNRAKAGAATDGQLPTRQQRMQYDLTRAELRAYGIPVNEDMANAMKKAKADSDSLLKQAETKMLEYQSDNNPETYAEAIRLANKAKATSDKAMDDNRIAFMYNTFKDTAGFDLMDNPEDAEGYSRRGYRRGVKAALDKVSTDVTATENDALMTALKGKRTEHTLDSGFKQDAWSFGYTNDMVLPEELFAKSTRTIPTSAYDRDFWNSDDEIKFKEALAANAFGNVEFIPSTRNGLIAVDGGMALSGKVRIPRNKVEEVFGSELLWGHQKHYKNELDMSITKYKDGDEEIEYYDFPVYKVLPRDSHAQYWDDVNKSMFNTNTYGGTGSATLMNDNAYNVNQNIINNAD